jgi:hypothetical protein
MGKYLDKVEARDLTFKHGDYNILVYTCQECGKNRYNGIEDSDDSIMGWYQIAGRWMIVWECQKCFSKWHHHDTNLTLYQQYCDMRDIKKKHNL